MVDKDARDEKWDMADRLRHEARQTRPSFSESLHARICRAVEDNAVAEPRRPAAPTLPGRVGIAAAVAATLAVGLLYLAWPNDSSTETVQKRPEMVEPRPSVDEELQPPTDIPGNPAVDIGLLVDETLSDRRWAYLDHDVQLAASMLLDQLPGSITSPEGDR